MRTIAFKIATAIKSANPEETASIAVLQYALSIIINSSVILIVSLVFGYISKAFMDTFITLCAVFLIRFFSGGAHFKSTTVCNLFSILLCITIPHISHFFYVPVFWLNFIFLMIVLLFAPRMDKNTLLSKNLHPYWKATSVILVLTNFDFNSPSIGLVFLVQSLFLIPWKGGHAKYEKNTG
ncbi:accessory gene regulator B family protein [Paenibacillus glufosinatiresistens]|uniref:accessory gene regulator B family protein n=1 Tax=Paenibacillus glufosinatiresistens TaxID=3070657 RepID=UPI00286DF239|nr:accessory gene regulator B family protein [Paenibacillus sp. YX.27]